MTPTSPQWTPRAVCFDLDDTLYDYRRYAHWGLQAAADYLERYTGHHLHTALHDLYFCEGVTEGTFDALLERHGLPAHHVTEMVETFHETSKPLVPYSGTMAVLEQLGATYRLGVVTDGRNGVQKLRDLGLEDRFDAVVVTPTIGSSKLAQEPFDQVLDALAVEPRETVYVGDDPRVDFRIPNRLGMGTVRVRRGRYTDIEPPSPAAAPAEEIRDLFELPALLGEPSVARLESET